MTARRLLSDAVARYRQIGIKSGLTNALSNLGWACAHLGALPAAARYLHEALSLALELGELPFGLEVLTRAAALLAQQDHGGRTPYAIDPAGILAFVVRHPALLDETRRAATALQARLGSGTSARLPSDFPAAARVVLQALEAFG
ncbi:MAG: hypothetical protein ACLFU8_13385 [Anaerolineales bacterium]